MQAIPHAAPGERLHHGTQLDVKHHRYQGKALDTSRLQKDNIYPIRHEVVVG